MSCSHQEVRYGPLGVMTCTACDASLNPRTPKPSPPAKPNAHLRRAIDECDGAPGREVM